MAELNINISAKIHAEIAGGDRTALAYTPVILDPVSNSYSTMGKITTYRLSVRNIYGLKHVSLLNNGKNSRFTAGGSGECEVNLYIEDDANNSAEDTIVIKVQ